MSNRNELCEYVKKGFIKLIPALYKYFLPASAAGIFQSNDLSLKHLNSKVASPSETFSTGLLWSTLCIFIFDPHELYKEQQL